jgi:signal recognition particle receptor subunit beta
MALLNYKKKEINAKIVYYGPGLSGKTTNIQFIHSKLRPDHRGKLMTLATQTDRTLFFDFLPVELGEIRGLKTRFQLYTVPGQVFYNATRKLVLKNVDGVVFIADSDPAHLADNLESLKNLEQNLTFHGKDIREIPLVIQYNKRDLPNAMSVADLQAKLNAYGAPTTEASSGAGGKGVLETLTLISKLVLQRLRDSQNITRVDEADGTMPDPGMSPADPSEIKAKAAPAAAKSISLKPAAPAPAAVAAPAVEEPELLADEIDVELDAEIEPEAEAEAPAPAPAVKSAAAGAPKVAFKRVVSAAPSGQGIDLTLAFSAGAEEITVALRLDIKPK